MCICLPFIWAIIWTLQGVVCLVVDLGEFLCDFWCHYVLSQSFGCRLSPAVPILLSSHTSTRINTAGPPPNAKRCGHRAHAEPVPVGRAQEPIQRATPKRPWRNQCTSMCCAPAAFNAPHACVSAPRRATVCPFTQCTTTLGRRDGPGRQKRCQRTHRRRSGGEMRARLSRRPRLAAEVLFGAPDASRQHDFL